MVKGNILLTSLSTSTPPTHADANKVRLGLASHRVFEWGWCLGRCWRDQADASSAIFYCKPGGDGGGDDASLETAASLN
eukprot:364798-Chlamydomonas_euryale.AAC.6